MIKSEAVRIAQLCEEEYSALVVNARDFSLAQPILSTSSCISPPPVLPPDTILSQPPVCLDSSLREELPIFSSQLETNMEENNGAYQPEVKSMERTFLGRTSRHFSQNSKDSVDSLDPFSNSVNADSQSDSDIEQQRGVFDYFRNSPGQVMKQELSMPSLPGGGDEAFDVDNDSSDDSDHLYGFTNGKVLFEDSVKNREPYSAVKDRMDDERGIEMKEFSRSECTRSYQQGRDDEDEEDDEFGFSKDLHVPYGGIYHRQESMNTITRLSNNIVYDEHVDVDSSDESLKECVVDKGDNLDRVTVHRPYTDVPDSFPSSNYRSSHNYMEDHSDSLEQGPKRRIKPSPAAPQFQAKSQVMYNKVPTTSYSKSVDAGVKFNALLSQSGGATSEGTNILSSETHANPPFGDPPNSEKIKNSAMSLIKSTNPTPANMPQGESVFDTLDRDDAASGGKKKKKKKKRGKN